MDANLLEDAAIRFHENLEKVKKSTAPDLPWYPYGILNSFIHLRPFFQEYSLESLAKSGRVVDIGAADGDLAFFLESLNYNVDIIDNPPTNFNGLRGAKHLKQQLKSNAIIHEIDLDEYFSMPKSKYDLIFFLGILYHLKNPFYVLEKLSYSTRHLLISTRVAQLGPNNQRIGEMSLAYLLGPMECNNDPTNFWIFTENGLRKLFDRCGWDIVLYRAVGDTIMSNPVESDHDERGFALLRSRHFADI